MAKVLKMWRTLTVVSVAALTLALVASAFAQEAPPTVPHQFYGSAETGSAALLDGEIAADGATVTAWDQDGESAGSATIGDIADSTWMIQVPATASSVTFSIDGSSQSESFAVTSGMLTPVALDLTSGMAMPDDGMAMPDDGMAMPDDGMAMPDDGMAMPDDGMEAPDALPATGSGGLTESGGGVPVLPFALLAAMLIALGGVAATRRAVR